MPLDDRDKIAHLLRRTGFAARPEEIEAGVARGLGATVDSVLNFQSVPDNLATLPNDPETNRPYLDLTFEEFRGKQGIFIGEVERLWLNAMITTTRPLQEKMVLFWHGLFATSAQGTADERQIYLQNENFRGNFHPDTGQVVRPTPGGPFPVGNFHLILEYLTKDPAMLFWLDNALNRRLNNEVGSNENYARELHELFSMGVEDVVAKVPNYTEQDIRQASRALTGWTIRRRSDNFPRTFFFDNSAHDPGPYTHLGKRGGNNANFIFDNVVSHKNTQQQHSAVGRFLGYRLFKFFGYDDLEPEIINALAGVFDGVNGGQPYIIANMLRTMFTPGNVVSEAFYSERAFKAHIKSPTEYIISAFRYLKPDGLGRVQNLIRPVLAGLISMGQYLLFPPDVSGWKEGLNWINTTFDLARFNFANSFATLPSGQGGISTDSLRATLTQNGAQTPEQVVDYFTSLMLQVTVPPEARTALVNYLRAGTDGTPGGFDFDLAENATIDNKVRSLIHLIMTMPEFQLS
ncbi:MAG: DUF1800 domain-containing protein [Acidobacteria bacterium]|nr:DUF1800 domain-containing protein [Acidobacteriota bacterium]